MKIFSKLKCIKHGLGLHSNMGRFSSIIKSKNAIFIHKNVQMREMCKFVVRNDGKLSIDNNVFFNRNVFITCRNKISIGANTIIGPNVVIVDHNHDYKSNDMPNSFVDGVVFIGKDVWIGANSTILPGAYIEDGAIIGANSVVSKKVGRFEIWCGAPAKYIKNR